MDKVRIRFTKAQIDEMVAFISDCYQPEIERNSDREAMIAALDKSTPGGSVTLNRAALMELAGNTATCDGLFTETIWRHIERKVISAAEALGGRYVRSGGANGDPFQYIEWRAEAVIYEMHR